MSRMTTTDQGSLPEFCRDILRFLWNSVGRERLCGHLFGQEEVRRISWTVPELCDRLTEDAQL